MEHTITYSDEHQLLHHRICGEYSTEDAIRYGKEYQSMLEGKPYKHLIVDLREAGKMESRETRSIINQTLNDAGITHVVYVGANATTRMIAKVLMKLGSLKADSDFGKDFDDAIQWIQKRR